MKQRLLSLDVLRGITIAGMILVNNPGSWRYVFAPLKHAPWIGLTPTDLVFPFFMFMMGISTYISLRKYKFEWSASVGWKILRRAVILFALGLSIDLYARLFDGGNPFEQVRILGVLQRFGICYAVAAVVGLTIKHRYIPYLIGVLLVGYFLILLLGNGFAYDNTNVLALADRAVLGSNHLLNDHGIDPEGVLSQLPSVAHVLIGFWCGRWLMQESDITRKMLRLLLFGAALSLAGYLLSYGCPISKKMWSPTFVMVTCGMAASLLAMLVWVIDVKGYKVWCQPFRTLGLNPLFVYLLSEYAAVTLDNISIAYHDRMISLHSYIYRVWLHPLLGGYGGSLAYALLFVATCWLVGYLLQRRNIYIKL